MTPERSMMNASPRHMSFDIAGMTCAACSTRVEKVIARIEGVHQVKVNLALERADMTAETGVSADAVMERVAKAGYVALPRYGGAAAEAENERRQTRQRADERQTLIRFSLSAVASIALVVGMIPPMTGMGPALISPGTQAVLAAWVFLFSGTRFFREAWAALRSGTTNMAVLVTLGTVAAFVFSLWKLSDPHASHQHLYFESAAVVLTLVMLGKYLEARARRGASAALMSLSRLVPDVAERLSGDKAEIVSVAALRIGDVLRIRPGSRVPADGMVVNGASEVDESLITGESLPVMKKAADTLIAGSVNGNGAVDIKVTALGPETRLGRMTSLVEMTQLSEAPIQKLVDRVSAVFVPSILVLAAVTFAGWAWWAADLETALINAVAVLVIACPCALGLATPTALVAGTGAAARAGILIRDIETLERARSIRCVAFDKTGTLTQGKAQLTGFRIALGFDEREVFSVALALEEVSEHPLAKALVGEARARGIAPAQVSTIRIIPGQSISGIRNGKTVSIGKTINRGDAQGRRNATGTSAELVFGNSVAATFDFADEARPEAAAAISDLQRLGIESVMLSGDNQASANKIGKALGLSAIHGDLSPQEKLVEIGKLRQRFGGVAFVGDGVNDAPALAAADVGIALSTGTDIARETAAFTLMRPDLRLVGAALAIADRTRRTIRQNLGWAFIYNVIGLPLAAFGYLSPIFAGAAMAFSSVSVVTNSAYLATWRPSFAKATPCKAAPS